MEIIENIFENKELLEELCRKLDISKSYNKIEIKLNDNDSLYFYISGYVCCMNEDAKISFGYDITPAQMYQMYQIRKSLIGEER